VLIADLGTFATTLAQRAGPFAGDALPIQLIHVPLSERGTLCEFNYGSSLGVPHHGGPCAWIRFAMEASHRETWLDVVSKFICDRSKSSKAAETTQGAGWR